MLDGGRGGDPPPARDPSFPPSTVSKVALRCSVQAPSRYWLIAMIGRFLFRLCVAIGVLVGGAVFLIGIKELAIYVLLGMVALGLLLRWVFGGGGFDDDY